VRWLTLRIRPVKLKQSIYFRVPNDIADLISLDSHADVSLTLQEQDDHFLLIYSVNKPMIADPRRSEIIRDEQSERLAPITAVQRSRRVENMENVSDARES
jgi:hypothetical protein